MQVGDVTPDGKKISKIEKIVGVRKMIANNMEESLRRSPQVSGFNHADVSGMVRLKKKLRAAGYKVTETEIFVKIVAMALEQYPDMNCSRQDKEIHFYSSINVGVAVGLPNGMLVVPVIKNCESKSLLEISADMKDIVAKAKENKITSDMMVGGTFTVTSIGMFGADSSDAIINIPQGGIICLGRIKKEPVVLEDDTFGICDKAYVTITLDHAIINGALASQYTNTVCEIAQRADELIPIPEL